MEEVDGGSGGSGEMGGGGWREGGGTGEGRGGEVDKMGVEGYWVEAKGVTKGGLEAQRAIVSVGEPQ